MLRQSSVLFLGLFSAFLGVTEGGCACTITWNVAQTAAGTCPAGLTGPNGEAYDWVVDQVLSGNNRRRLQQDVSGGCTNVAGSTAAAGCVPISGGSGNSRRRLQDGCNQCTGADDDQGDDDFGHLDDDRRRLDYNYYNDEVGVEEVKKESLLEYSVTADVPDGEDPIAIMNAVEIDLEDFFKDEENARVTWITKARELGSLISEDAQVTFSAPVVNDDSIVVTSREDSEDKDYVLVGIVIGVCVVSIVMMAMSAKYGQKVFKSKHGADVMEQEKGGEVTMNPLGDSVVS